MGKIYKDPSGYVFVKLYMLRRHISIFISSVVTTSLARLKGVRVDGKLKCWGCTYFMRLPNSTISIGRGCILNSAFASNNVGVYTRSRITTLTQSAEIKIGNDVGMTSVTVSAAKYIEIGDHAMIGANTLITDTDWHPLAPQARDGKIEEAGMKDVVIGRNVFVGTGSIILKGTVIGDNTVIGAGSVVSGTIPADVIAGGNPCRVIKSLK